MTTVTMYQAARTVTTVATPRNRAESTAQMRAALLATTVADDGGAGFDALVMAAAVADFRPSRPAETKLTRDERLTLELEPTPDLLAEIGRIARGVDTAGSPSRRPLQPRPVLVGFAAETGSLERAGEKLRSKGVDLMVANDVSEPGSGFGTDTGQGQNAPRQGIEAGPVGRVEGCPCRGHLFHIAAQRRDVQARQQRDRLEFEADPQVLGVAQG